MFLELSRNEHVTSTILNVNTCSISTISTCYHASELQEHFCTTVCSIFCFSGYTDQACDTIKIMPVISTTIDFALGTNGKKKKD